MVNNSAPGTKRLVAASLLTAGLYGCGGGGDTTNTVIDPTIAAPPVAVADQPESDWALVWSDEFDGDAIDSNKWSLEVDCQGGGNNEKQCYTDDPRNSFVADGILNIVAMPTPEDLGLPLPYTSARLNTRYKGDFTYGRFEARIKLPGGQGSWPAFWMLPTDYEYGGWPKSGEIDILETVNLGVVNESDGNTESYIHGTLHYGEDWPNNVSSGKAYMPPSNPKDDFHTYAIEWQEGEIRWYMDGYLYATQQRSVVRTLGDGTPVGLAHKGWFVPQFNPVTGEQENLYTEAPYDKDFHLILNFAVGGDWPENVNNLGIDASAFEGGQAMEVDWVRVYECATDPVTGKGCESVRSGYNVPEADGGALVEGAAPSPTPPVPDVATPITIFDEGENPDWPLWDCCGGTEPAVVMDEDASRGAVAEFQILNNDGTVLGFNSRIGESGEAFNAAAMLTNGSLKFDMKVVSPPSSATTWILKVEADGNTSFAEIALNTSNEGMNPETGEWQTYTFPLSFLSDSGLNVGAIDVIMIFPAWQTGEGAIYRVDNVTIAPDNGGGAPSAELVMFDEGANADWSLWDCCGGTTPTEEMDDDRGIVAEFQILNNDGTVLGFNGRENGATFDASSIVTDGVLEFDMKVVSPPGTETTWLLKVEADGNTSFAEVPLNTSTQGADPVTGEWQTYTFPLLALSDAGLDISAIDVVMIFPAWQTGGGAIYRIDTARIYNPNATGGGAPSGPLLQVFADGANEGWPMWDCCGGTTPTVEMDDAAHGAVAEFQILDNNGTVLGFNSRDANTTPFDASSVITTGVLQFEMKVTSPPSGDTTWLLKVEANGNTSFAEVPLNTSQEGADPVTGEWQTYTFDLLSLSDTGLDVSGIDVIMIFPAWQTGEGAIYRVDNLYVGNPSDISGDNSGGNGGGESEAALTIFADQANEGWPLWDCCGGTTPTVEMVDGYGAVAQFEILDNNGTVLGFFSRDAGTPFDASPYVASGKFKFDMKVVNPPGETTWLLKIEANGNTSFAEVPLNTSVEGMDPVTGEWQTYTFDLLSLLDAGLDVSGIDVVMIFPAWQTGEGAIYQVDNVVVTAD